MNLNLDVVKVLGAIVGVAATAGKAIHWIWVRFNEKDKEIKTLRNENEELKIHVARQSAVLEMTSNYLKKTVSEGLQSFVDKNDNK
jgi:hypothetical protein